jgi:hypothetical protein
MSEDGKAANIGVIFGGDIGPLKDSMKKAETLLGGFSEMAKGAGKAILAMGAGAAAAAAGGMAAITVAAANNAREIKALAAVANVSVDSMQKLAHASQSVNIPMDKMADMLKDVNEKLGEFSRTGGGELKDFFEDIAPQVGLTIDSFKRLSGDEALVAYYNALERANLSQQDMTKYMEGIASDSSKLIPLLRDNGAALKEMAAEAEALGLSMSAIEIEQLEQFNRAFDRAKGVIKGAGNSIAVELAPYVTLLADRFVDAQKGAGGLASAVSSAFELSIRSAAVFADGLHGIHIIFKGLHVAAAAVGTGIIQAFSLIPKAVEGAVNFAIFNINLLISALNALPYVDIDKIGYAEFGSAMDGITQTAVGNLKELTSELHSLAMEKTYGQAAIEFLDQVKIKSQEAAAEAAKLSQGQFEKGKIGSSALPKDAEDKDSEADKLARDAEIEAARREMAIQSLKDRYITEEELLKQHRETMALIGEEYDATQFESEEQWRSIREQAQAEHAYNMNRLREMEKVNAVAIAGDLAQSLMSLSQGQSRKVFEFSKKAAMASAVIDGYKAATSAWAAGMSTGGPWAPLVAASYTAASLAKTGAQVRAIQSQSFGGGGGQSDVGGSGMPSIPAGGGGFAAPGGGGGSAGTVAINLPAGAIIRGDALLDMIEEAVNNGKNVSFLRA